MRRKVVKHGPSSLIVSLPSNWCKENNVEQGKEVDVVEQGSSLVISSDFKEKPLSLDVDISGLDRTTIMYVIRSFYRLGYDEVTIRFSNPQTAYQRNDKNVSVTSVIHQEINRLVGYEVIQEKSDMVLVKDLQESSIKDFDQILRRIFLLLNDAMADFAEGAKTNNSIMLETIEQKHDNITKFVSYCLRMLNKKKYPEARKTCYYYHIIATLDRLMDIIKYAARDLIDYDKKLSPDVEKICFAVKSDFAKYYSLFYEYDNSKIKEINDSRYELEKKLKSFSSKINSKEVAIASSLFHVLEILLDLIEARTALEY